MKFALAAAALAMTTTGFATAADARPKDRRAVERAYEQGYRDALRQQQQGYWVDSRFQPAWQGSGWDDRRTARQWQDPRWTNRQPVFRSAAQSPYWWGPNGQVYCRRSDGTTGTIVGAVAGGTLGNIIAQEGDKRLGSVIGGTLGAILGREIERGNARCR